MEETKEYNTRGIEVLCDVWGVDFDKLDDLPTLMNVMREGATLAGAHVRREVGEKFEPSGVTVAMVLSESHFTIHTYPQKGFIAINCFTCGEHVDPKVAVEHLIEHLQPKNKTNVMVIERGTVTP